VLVLSHFISSSVSYSAKLCCVVWRWHNWLLPRQRPVSTSFIKSIRWATMQVRSRLVAARTDALWFVTLPAGVTTVLRLRTSHVSSRRILPSTSLGNWFYDHLATACCSQKWKGVRVVRNI
jgi:hypothetical protein